MANNDLRFMHHWKAGYRLPFVLSGLAPSRAWPGMIVPIPPNLGAFCAGTLIDVTFSGVQVHSGCIALPTLGNSIKVTTPSDPNGTYRLKSTPSLIATDAVKDYLLNSVYGLDASIPATGTVLDYYGGVTTCGTGNGFPRFTPPNITVELHLGIPPTGDTPPGIDDLLLLLRYDYNPILFEARIPLADFENGMTVDNEHTAAGERSNSYYPVTANEGPRVAAVAGYDGTATIEVIQP